MDGTVGTSSVPDVLLELTDSLGAEFDTAGLLFHLAAVSVELLDVDAAGVLLVDEGGRLVQIVATDEGTRNLEQLQARSQRGPCLESVRVGETVICPDLEQTTRRWAEFCRLARAEGFRAVYAVPMGLRGEIVGGLNLFRRQTGALSEVDRRTAMLLATAAATGLLHRRAVHQRDTLNEQLRQALSSRIIIEQAKGFLAAQRALSPELAFTLLRSHARSRQERLTNVAQAVVDGRVVLPDPAA